ncbi:hypothetical protein, partial [Vibrio sp. EA2]|uniref:hypothetical protein n=1 Tax=Vibrio sp. EA2 TaxID=3079860 RepID=UPI0029494078
VLGMVLVMVLLLAKQIITLYHAVQKTLTKDQHAIAMMADLRPLCSLGVTVVEIRKQNDLTLL